MNRILALIDILLIMIWGIYELGWGGGRKENSRQFIRGALNHDVPTTNVVHQKLLVLAFAAIMIIMLTVVVMNSR